MSFRISDLMITVLPQAGQLADCRPGFTSCPGGCSQPNTQFPPDEIIESNELIEIRAILRHAISRVEASNAVQPVLPDTSEEIEALEQRLLSALHELRSYKATIENAKDM